jgi:nitrite reductase/ring-hydroxylating ferredoxin subunit
VRNSSNARQVRCVECDGADPERRSLRMASKPVVQAAAVTPGNLVAVEVGGVRIAIANVNGQLYAFDDTCTHEQCSLAEGILEDAVVTCPCHGAQFDVKTGRVVAPPAPSPVRSYPLRVENGQVVLEI